MNTSDELYEKAKELEENKLLKFKLLKSEEELVGKTIKNVYNTSIYYYNGFRRHILMVFSDGSAVLYEESIIDTCPFLQNSYQLDGKGEAYLTDLARWLDDLGYINQNVANEMLDTLVKWQEANYAKNIKEDIQRKLDEISKLKEKL